MSDDRKILPNFWTPYIAAVSFILILFLPFLVGSVSGYGE